MSKLRRNIMMWNRPIEMGVPTPTISPEAGSILSSQTVSISISGRAVSAEYSFDNESWDTYSSSLTLTSSTTVYARAVDGDGNYSEVVSNSYTLRYYDAKVEYLESSGNQYINTSFTNTTLTDFYMDFQLTGGTTQDRKLIGNSGKFGFATYNGKWRTIGTSWFFTSTATDTNRHVVHTQSGVFYVDSVLLADRSSYTGSGSYPMFLFAASNGASSKDGNAAIMKLYECKIYDNSVLVRDMIPVRVGTVGYMFDNVTKQLYGNIGSNSFTFGNDITT